MSDMRTEVVETPYGEINVAVAKCEYCGVEKLTTWPGWVQLDHHQFCVEPHLFCSLGHGGLYFVDRARTEPYLPQATPIDSATSTHFGKFTDAMNNAKGKE